MSRARPTSSKQVVLVACLFTILGIAIALAIFSWTANNDTKPRALASATASTINVAQQNQLAMIKACRIYEQAKQDEARTIIKNFVRHGKAHKAMGEMPLGDRMDPKPGTIRWEWKITLAQLWEHEPMWREAVNNYDKAGCGQ